MTGKSKLKIKFKLCFCTQLLIEKLNGAKTNLNYIPVMTRAQDLSCRKDNLNKLF